MPGSSFQRASRAFVSRLGQSCLLAPMGLEGWNFPKHFYHLRCQYCLVITDFSGVDMSLETIKSKLLYLTIEVTEAQGHEMSHRYR